jgi:sec-independent protein translocase protein TatC
MFDIGWSELLVIAVVAIVVVGPKELPKLMRSFGFYAGKLRRAAAEFRRQFDDAMREAELEEVKKAIESVRTETRARLKAPSTADDAGSGSPPRRAAAKVKPARSVAQTKPRQARQERRGARNIEARISRRARPLIEHLIELRRRLVWALLAIFLAFLVCFWFAKPIYNLLLWPYRLAAGSDAPIEMIYTAPQEFFFTQVKLALFGAVFIAFPVLATQIYMFVAPGLYRNERQAFLPFLIATPVLFLLGAALVYFMAMPLAMKFFLSMQQTGEGQVQIQLTARVSEYLSLIMALILGFGICFQLPVVLTLLARAGMITADQLKRYRRHAIFAVFVVAAVLTPPDPISQITLAVPTVLLYELSIYAVRLAEKKHAASAAASATASAGKPAG